MPIYPPGFASIGDFLKIFVWQNAPPSLGKSGFRSSTKYPIRFILGSDTWVNQRWLYYDELMQGYRTWLGDLPAVVARNIAWINGASVFGLN